MLWIMNPSNLLIINVSSFIDVFIIILDVFTIIIFMDVFNITGLANLIELTWLDLSGNKIEVCIVILPSCA